MADWLFPFFFGSQEWTKQSFLAGMTKLNLVTSSFEFYEFGLLTSSF